MKLYKIEFDEITTFIGTIEAETLEKAKEIIQSNCHYPTSLTNVEPVIGETIIQHIEEI
tara:strand:+ start:264 stop:440 length:177 start_codon:yes stop_codon:yes gene_type:complete